MTDTYSVSLMLAPLPQPLSFTTHAYFVICHNGRCDRIEIWYSKKYECNYDNSLFYINAMSLFSGFRSNFFRDVFNPRKTIPTICLGKVEGGEGSIASQMYELILESINTYPYRDYYRIFPGPNSNTYVQWVLNQFPKSNFNLPWNALGKNFKM